jgi:hypothetical protein
VLSLPTIGAVALALAGCGGTHLASVDEAPMPDAGGVPPPPMLGVQLDRLGRPAISTALIAVFGPAGAAQAAQKDAYHRATDPATWATAPLQANVTIERELATNLAVFDALDTGLSLLGAGCGNALRYSGPPGATSYLGAARLFADDRLYVDTSKATCTTYLALEIELASAGSYVHDTCGGRTLTHDAIDVLYSVVAAGIAGLDPGNGFAGRIRDGVGPHSDVTNSFPFLGPPH